MDLSFWKNGPSPGFLCSNNNNLNSISSSTCDVSPIKRTLNPSVTGSSVLGVTFQNGVVLAADTLGSYGSLAKFRNLSRLYQVNNTTVIGAGGDYADFQYVKRLIEQTIIDEECLADGFNLSPVGLHEYLTRLSYVRRSNFDPLWLSTIVAGVEGDNPFLGYVDKLGMSYSAPTLATGYGSYIALPLLRDAYEKANGSLTYDQAEALIDRALRVLFYRDARSWNQYELAIVTKDGVKIESKKKSQTNWDIAHLVRGYE